MAARCLCRTALTISDFPLTDLIGGLSCLATRYRETRAGIATNGYECFMLSTSLGGQMLAGAITRSTVASNRPLPEPHCGTVTSSFDLSSAA
jgi:hypothetical protein